MVNLIYKDLSYTIQGAFFEVYKNLGNGFKENIYHKALLAELTTKGLTLDNQKRIEIFYKDIKAGTYIPDLIVNDLVLIELKAKPRLIDTDKKQFWYYLKGSYFKLGYLVNFGSPKRVEYLRKVYDTARK